MISEMEKEFCPKDCSNLNTEYPACNVWEEKLNKHHTESRYLKLPDCRFNEALQENKKLKKELKRLQESLCLCPKFFGECEYCDEGSCSSPDL